MFRFWPYLLLFLSGLSALSYQVVWMREFRLVFGASTASTAAVSALFMAGLGLGGWLLGPRADRHDRPLMLYGRLELAISILAGLSPLILGLTRSLYLKSGGMMVLGLGGATLARLALAALVIGVPAFLMGGTLPAAARAVTAEDDGNRRSLGTLYGLNTIGALTGVILTTFLVLEALGARDTLILAVLINFCTALTAISLAGRRPAIASSAASPAAETAEEASLAARLPLPLTLGTAALVGFVFFLMELVWYRMLGPVLGGSIYTFGLILATALAGIGLGGALHPLVFRNRTPQAWHLAVTCILEALAIMLPYAAGDWVASLANQLRILSAMGFGGLTASWAAITVLVVLPAAIISGIQFPLIISLLGRGAKNLGRQTGLVYAFNTGGAILGSLAGGFGLMPKLSAPGCWVLSGAILLSLGTIIALVSIGRVKKTAGEQPARIFGPALPAMLLVMILTVLCLMATGPTSAWRHSPIGAGRTPVMTAINDIKHWMHETRRFISWEADGVESSVAINNRNGYAFMVNGKADGNVIEDRGTQIMIGLLGAALHPKPERALVVGLGTGCTTGWLSEVPEMSMVEVVELEPAVLHMARISAIANHDVVGKSEAGQGVRIIVNDAREVLNTAPDKYDLIVSEPSNPYRAGIASLFTREFYQEVANRLAPGGLFVTWCQSYEIETESVFGIMATLKTIFPYVECWTTQYPGDMAFVASMNKINPDPQKLAARLDTYPFKDAMKIAWGTEGLNGLMAYHLANNDFVNEAVKKVSPHNINTDDLTPVEYAYAHTVGQTTGFHSSDLLAAAERAEQDLPDWAKNSISRSTKSLYLLASSIQVGRGNFSMSLDLMTETDQKRAQALAGWQGGDFQPILQLDEDGHQPILDVEKLALAEALASKGDDRALTILPAIEQSWPASAEFIRASLANKQENYDEALEAVERAFKHLRLLPWESATVLNRGHDFIQSLLRAHPQYAPRIYAAMEEPLALSLMESQRRRHLLEIAQLIDPQTVDKTLTRWFEPNIPWSIEILTLRSVTYSQTKNPLWKQALDDMLLYMEATNINVDQFLKLTSHPDGQAPLPGQ